MTIILWMRNQDAVHYICEVQHPDYRLQIHNNICHFTRCACARFANDSGVWWFGLSVCCIPETFYRLLKRRTNVCAHLPPSRYGWHISNFANIETIHTLSLCSHIQAFISFTHDIYENNNNTALSGMEAGQISEEVAIHDQILYKMWRRTIAVKKPCVSRNFTSMNCRTSATSRRIAMIAIIQ